MSHTAVVAGLPIEMHSREGCMQVASSYRVLLIVRILGYQYALVPPLRSAHRLQGSRRG